MLGSHLGGGLGPGSWPLDTVRKSRVNAYCPLELRRAENCGYMGWAEGQPRGQRETGAGMAYSSSSQPVVTTPLGAE